MDSTMLGVALREICGPLVDFLNKLMGPNGPEWWAAFKRFLRKENPWLEALLTLLGTVAVLLPAKFVAADNFKVNTAQDASVNISYIGDNFKTWFGGKTEKFSAKSRSVTLRNHSLNKNSTDGPIIAELGGEEKVETSLAAVFAFMQRQPSGQQGALLAHGYANIFYVRDTNKVLRAVGVHWYGDGWHVHAHSVEPPVEWRAGYRVFSR